MLLFLVPQVPREFCRSRPPSGNGTVSFVWLLMLEVVGELFLFRGVNTQLLESRVLASSSMIGQWPSTSFFARSLNSSCTICACPPEGCISRIRASIFAKSCRHPSCWQSG